MSIHSPSPVVAATITSEISSGGWSITTSIRWETATGAEMWRKSSCGGLRGAGENKICLKHLMRDHKLTPQGKYWDYSGVWLSMRRDSVQLV